MQEVEDRIQLRSSFVVNADREIANEKKQFPASQHHSSLSWQFQEQHSIDDLNRKPGQSSRVVSTPRATPSNTSASTARIGNRPFLSSATTGLPGIAGPFHSLGAENPSGQSPLRRRSPSPPVSGTILILCKIWLRKTFPSLIRHLNFWEVYRATILKILQLPFLLIFRMVTYKYHN